ncbi:MAG: Crp/Fnr family transcriptional regulator [Bryobacterales bacterium]
MATVLNQPVSSISLWEDPLVLLPRRKPQSFSKDQMIYDTHDSAESIFLLVDGAVKISRFSTGGRETVIDVESRESFFGLTAVLGEGEGLRGEMAVALEPTQVMEWKLDELRTMIARTPELGAALMRVVARKLNDADNRIESFAVDHIPQRLVKALLRLGDRFGEPKGPGGVLRLMPLTHDLIAKHVGTSREIITQHMSKLRRRGLLSYSRAGLEIDPLKLRAELEKSGKG